VDCGASRGAICVCPPTRSRHNDGKCPIAAASKARIPTIAKSSLNWADVFYHYCGHLPGCKSDLATNGRCIRYGAYVFATCARNADAQHSQRAGSGASWMTRCRNRRDGGVAAVHRPALGTEGRSTLASTSRDSRHFHQDLIPIGASASVV
jgi:hypothetical protein